ncbi:LppU/SCO3897 family protein [Streptomyces armeniacus]|nr:hypothetical protein [Streptomyces armeniacus]
MTLGFTAVVAGLVAFAFFGPSEGEDESADLKRGDCFENTGTEDAPTAEKRACTDDGADYRVLKVNKETGFSSFACDDVPGATGTLSQQSLEKDGDSFVVCFKDN